MKVRIVSTPNHLADSPAAIASPDKGYYSTRNLMPLLARILLSGLFLKSGIDKILHPVGTQQYMEAHGIPLTGLFLLAAIAVELVGGLSLLLGYKARFGAILLALFLIPVTLIFHTNLADQIQNIMFMKNLAILGGLLMVIQYGPGLITLERDL